MDLLTPNAAQQVYLTNGLSAITPGGVKKLVSMVAAASSGDPTSTPANRPPYVPEKMLFSSYRKFEGEWSEARR